MKIVNTTKLFVMNKVKTQGIKDPSKTYHKLVVSQDEDAGTINCPEEVFNAVKANEVFTFVTEYNEKYESFRIVSVIIPTSASTEKPKN